MNSNAMSQVAFGILLAGAMAFPARAAIPYQGYQYGSDITFGGYTGSEVLTNFPALVKINTGIANFSYSQLQSGSADLRFVNPADMSALNYEIDTWNTSGDSYVWVQVPRLTNNAAILMYWGKASDTAPVYTTNGATWAEGFVGNWHMNERNVKDSTVYARNGNSAPTAVTNAVGLVGTAQGYQANGGTALTGNILLTNQTLLPNTSSFPFAPSSILTFYQPDTTPGVFYSSNSNSGARNIFFKNFLSCAGCSNFSVNHGKTFCFRKSLIN